MKKSHEVSEEELNQEINDKLNQLWTNMNNKRKKLVKSMTPGYSRRTDQSQLNQSSNFATENQLFKMRDKLANEVSASKHKQLEIQNLKKTIVQLNNDKKLLIYELQQAYNGNQNVNSSILNQSSIHQTKLQINKNTANFESIKQKKKNKSYATIDQEAQQMKFTSMEEQTKAGGFENLQDLSKARLIQLLRSTSEYRQFAYYYDSHQLSYLKKLQEQHKKNCDNTASVRERSFWAPAQILEEVKRISKKEKWGVSQFQIQSIISCMKNYFERNLEQKAKKLKDQFSVKLRKQQRQAQNIIPYDLVQICKIKERQLSQQGKKNRTSAFK